MVFAQPPTALVTVATAPPTSVYPTSIKPNPRMPAEKFDTSPSNPLRVLGRSRVSSSLVSHPPSGPMIIAPGNIGILLPKTTPIVAIPPTAAPRAPCTILPPVDPIRSGSSIIRHGSESLARYAFGYQPAGMNSAVSSPQPMKTGMFGVTIPARNAPNF
jgi:hypothetical protein